VAYHERVRAGYLAMTEQEPDRWAAVDATQDIDVVQEFIRDLVMARRDLGATKEGKKAQ
jgi:dTMP kinase